MTFANYDIARARTYYPTKVPILEDMKNNSNKVGFSDSKMLPISVTNSRTFVATKVEQNGHTLRKVATTRGTLLAPLEPNCIQKESALPIFSTTSLTINCLQDIKDAIKYVGHIIENSTTAWTPPGKETPGKTTFVFKAADEYGLQLSLPAAENIKQKVDEYIQNLDILPKKSNNSDQAKFAKQIYYLSQELDEAVELIKGRIARHTIKAD